MKIIDDKNRIEQDYSIYLSDESKLKGNSNAIFFPENIDDLKQIIKSHYLQKNPLTISNARTGIVGGAVPFGIDLISLEKLNQIIDLKEDILHVQSGVSLAEINQFLQKEKKEYFYPIDVTETSAAIGGTIATDASGGRSFHYGSTRKWIKSIKVILPSGEELFIPRGKFLAENKKLGFLNYELNLPDIKQLKVKNVAGYYIQKDMDLIDLFIGSEGTLGVIAEAEIKLVLIPEGLFAVVIFFPTEGDGLNFFFQALGKLKTVYAYEFFDENSLKVLSKEFPVGQFESAIFLEITGTDSILDELGSIIEENNSNMDNTWFGENKKEIEKIKDFRHKLPEMINSMIASRKNTYPEIHKISTDIAVSLNQLKEMIGFYHKVLEKEKIFYCLFGHIGESHLHLNMIPDDDKEFIKAKEINKQFIQKAISLSGTFAAEHGVGRLKKEFMKYLFTEDEIKGMWEIKKQLDPYLILNPGVMF